MVCRSLNDTAQCLQAHWKLERQVSVHPGVLCGIGPASCHSLLLLLPTGYSISSFLQMLHPECKELPEPNLLPGQLSHGAVGVKEGRVQWISMAFESVSLGALSSLAVLNISLSTPVPQTRERHPGFGLRCTAGVCQ